MTFKIAAKTEPKHKRQQNEVKEARDDRRLRHTAQNKKKNQRLKATSRAIESNFILQLQSLLHPFHI